MTPEDLQPPHTPDETAVSSANQPRRRWPGNERVEVIVGIAVGLIIVIVWVWSCRG